MPKKKTTLIRSPDFKTIYAVGAIGTWTPYDFRINFYSEKVVEDEEDAFLNDTQVILSPKATKEFALWLLQNIKDYETTYGRPIPAGATQRDEETGEFRSDLRTELKSDLKSELQEDVKELINSDFKDRIKKDLGEELKTDLRKYYKQNLPNDLKKDLKVMPTPELKKDLKKVLKADLKQDLRQDLKHDLRKDIKKDLQREFQRDLHTGTITTSAQKTKPKKHKETIPSRKRGKVGKRKSTAANITKKKK
jgi:hypothetical protein